MHTYSATLKKYIAPSELMAGFGQHVTPEIITMDKERLLGVIVLQGIPFETTSDKLLKQGFDTLNEVFLQISKTNAPHLQQWNHIVHHEAEQEFNYKFKNDFAARFAKQYLAQFQEGKFYQTFYAISFVYKHRGDIDGGIEKLEQLMKFSKRILKKYDPVALSLNRNFLGTIMSEVGGYLSRLVNGEDQPVPMSSNRMVDTIQSASLHFGHDVCEMRPASGGKRYATYFDLKEFPEKSKRGMFNFLLNEPYEFILTQSFHYLGAMDTLSKIDSQVNKLKSATHAPEHYIADLEKVRQFVGTGEICFGDYHSSLIVYGDTPEEAQENGNNLATNIVASCGARFVRATGAGIYTYFSGMPGSANRPFAEPKTTRNLASAFSLNNYPVGKARGNPIGDGTAVIPLKTKADSLYYLSPHYSHPAQNNRGEKKAGHSLLLGATGAGKTTLEGTIVTFLERFEAKIFAIDFNRSMQLFLQAYGTQYFDIEDGVQTGINPFQLKDTPKTRAYLYRLLGACGRESDGTLEAEDEGKIKKCVDIIMQLDFADRRFSYVRALIPPTGGNSLGDRLAKWQHSCGGSMAWALDSPTNMFDPSTMNRVGFNTTSILVKDHPASEPILSALFHMKELMQVDGKLFLTLVEEFWVPCNYPTTQMQIKSILKAGRLKGEFLFLVSQSPEDATSCEIFAAIIQQTPTKIFLPNPEGSFEQYKLCGLNQKEFDMLSALDLESRTFLIKQGGQSVFAKLDLYGFDDFLPIISATQENIEVANEVMAEHGMDADVWVPIYIQRLKDNKEALAL